MKTSKGTMATEKSRVIAVDVIRVIAMLMVLVLHTVLSFTARPDFFATKLWFTLEPIVAISKPAVLLFFMLSGYLIINKSQTIKENWQRAKKRIIVPLAFFSVINIIYAFSNFTYTGDNGLAFFQSQLVRVTNFPSSPMWFLVVLLFFYLLNPVWQLIYNDEKNRAIARYIVLLSFSFAAFVTFIKYPALKNEVFFNNFTSWIGFLFFYLYGGLVKKKWIDISNTKKNVAMVLISLVIIMSGDYLNTYATTVKLNYIWNGYTFDYLSIPVMLLAVGLFNLLIQYDFAYFLKHKRVDAVLVWLASMSFGVYLIHTYVVSIFTDKIGFDFNKLAINVYLYNLLNYALVLSISLVITYLILKTPKVRKILGA